MASAVGRSIRLNSGYLMPTLGLGTFTIFNNPEGQMNRVIRAAIKEGYRHIDTAKIYSTEPLIGPVLSDMIKQGDIKREDVFITCKVWNTDHQPEHTRKGVEQSLKDLHTDYIDMYLIHWPMAFKSGDELFPKDSAGEVLYEDTDYLDTWRTLEALVDEGKIRSIGLSNVNVSQMERVLKIARIKPANLQVELNAYMANQQVVDWCKSQGVVVSCYAPFGNPGRTWKEASEPNLLEDPVVKRLGAKHNKTNAQVLLRFLLQKGYVVLPKTVTETRLAENIDVYDFELSGEDMTALDSLNRNLRVYKEPIAVKSPYYPWSDEL